MTNTNGRRTDTRRLTGQFGEEQGVQLLLEAGYTILHRNWRCRSGEIDIVAANEGVLVFVEVRTRTSGGRFGMAVESVDWRKQRQVRSIAEIYLRTYGYGDMSIRFDVMAFMIDRLTNDIIESKHISGAF
ncbi:putative endonuclease [Paenibacillus phyllosphaerae]|uniref:UPF0102 protein FHS18_001427 n=1 Tax=Paenibacillus phyllosphaerae TaxID=274593 RepID=A0A7W5FLM1_9BACL|nr:YraN family protein [Paenibacillus phyllosphaerae]MBB3109375.1 putative endonuclease [Paenibacillus phyllosphaerae]